MIFIKLDSEENFLSKNMHKTEFFVENTKRSFCDLEQKALTNFVGLSRKLFFKVLSLFRDIELFLHQQNFKGVLSVLNSNFPEVNI